jgi:hypothetical protein
MTCKDCLHFKVCEYEGVYFEDVAIEASSADGIEDLCPLFENKADFSEVVRCKDCLYYTPIPWNKEEMVCQCYTDWLFTEPTDFCSNGERKEE